MSEGSLSTSLAAPPEGSTPRVETPGNAGNSGKARWRTWAWTALVVGIVAVHLPALGTPFVLDDYAQIAMADGQYPGHHGPFDLYDFLDDSNRSALVDLGVVPWWTTSTLVVRFLRPLSSLILWTDHRLFGRVAWLFHLHSMLWWGLACVAVHTLYRRCFSPRVAALGATAFALSPCHVIPLAWIANREALVSIALGAFALASYVRWRDERRVRDGILSGALFALALAAGEYTLCFTGYVLALEATRRREGLVARALGLVAFALPAAVYLYFHTRLGYGAHGGGLYHDPLHDPGAYLEGAPRRLAVLLTSAWLGTDDGWWSAASGWMLGTLVVAGLALLVVPVARTFRALTAEGRARATWMLCGSFIALGPVLAVEPNRRLLGVSAIGIAAVAALVIDRAWFPPPGEAPSAGGLGELSRFAALALSFVFFVRGPIDTVSAARAFSKSAEMFRERMHWVSERIGDSNEVVAVRANSIAAALSSPFALERAKPVRWRVLTYASGRSLMLRTSERAIDLVASPNPLFPVGPAQLFRGYGGSLHPGDVISLAGVRVTIVQVDESGSPRRIHFEFDRDLSDPSILWVTEGDDGFREQTLPQKGYGEPIKP